MKNHIGLSFSVEDISFAHFIRNEDQLLLDRVGRWDYLQPYQPLSPLPEDEIPDLAQKIRHDFEDLSIAVSGISVSVEANLTLSKRVIFPRNLDPAGRRDHILWDLSESLNQPIADYLIHESRNISHLDLQDEELVVAIPRSVMHKVKEFARFAEFDLTTLSTNHFSCETLVQNYVQTQPDQLIMLVKPMRNRLETIFFLNGTYFISHYEYLSGQSSGGTKNLFIDQLKEKIAYIENLIEQSRNKSILVDRVMIYGGDVTEDFIQRIQKNMSVPVVRLNPLPFVKMTDRLLNDMPDEINSSRYVECIGIGMNI